MTGGLAFEGLNNAGSLRKNLLVVLNDNTWSISKNVGAISKYLTSIMADEKFNKLRREVWELTGRFKRRDAIRETVKRIENSIKNFLVPGMLFEKLGFRYFGPIDGHDLLLLVKTLQDISNLTFYSGRLECVKADDKTRLERVHRYWNSIEPGAGPGSAPR